MIDAALVAIVLALAIRGWFRGLVRELIGIGVLVLGIGLSFRTSEATGGVVSNLTGWSPAWSRLVGGVLLLLVLSIVAALIGSSLHRAMKALPGFSALNRLAGAALGVGAGALVIIVVVSLASIVGLPPAAADEFEESTAVSLITEPEGPVQTVIRGVGGSRQVGELLALRSMVGAVAAVPDEGTVALVPVDVETLAVDERAARELFDDLNLDRASAQVDPVTWSSALSVIAADLAFDMYASGVTITNNDVIERLDAAGLPFVLAEHHVALAVAVSDLDFALGERTDISAERVDDRYRRVGIGVVDGPYGLLMVEIFTA